jgi:hypothetical protein
MARRRSGKPHRSPLSTHFVFVVLSLANICEMICVLAMHTPRSFPFCFQSHTIVGDFGALDNQPKERSNQAAIDL